MSLIRKARTRLARQLALTAIVAATTLIPIITRLGVNRISEPSNGDTFASAALSFLPSVARASENQPYLFSSIEALSTSAFGIFTYDTYAAVATNTGKVGQLKIVDLSNPKFPAVKSIITARTHGGNMWNPFVFGRFAYFSANDLWETWDISNLSSPSFVSAIKSPDGSAIYEAKVLDSKVYLATDKGSFYVYDITDRANPILLSSLALSHTNVGMVVRGTYAYISAGGEIGKPLVYILNIANPAKPFISGQIMPIVPEEKVDVLGIQVNGNFLYAGIAPEVCTDACQMRVYDISNPNVPLLVGSYGVDTTSSASGGILLEGHLLYMGRVDPRACPGLSGCGIDVIDVSNPASPERVAFFSTGENAPNQDGIAQFGKYLTVLDGDFRQRLAANFVLIDLSGIDAASATIGQAKIGDVLVDGDLNAGAVYARTHLKVGPLGIGSQGPISGSPGGSICSWQKYRLSNDGVYFTVNGLATITIPASEIARPTLFALPPRGKIEKISLKTIAACSGNGFLTCTTTVGDSVGGDEYYTSSSYDLHIAVSDANFQDAMPGFAASGVNVPLLHSSATFAGSDVKAILTANRNWNASALHLVVDYEVCWSTLP